MTYVGFNLTFFIFSTNEINEKIIETFNNKNIDKHIDYYGELYHDMKIVFSQKASGSNYFYDNISIVDNNTSLARMSEMLYKEAVERNIPMDQILNYLNSFI
jgi:hypothetical protein